MGIHMDPFPVRAYCPSCGELCSHAVLGRDEGGRRLRCKGCGHEWRWTRRYEPRVAATSEAERRKPKPKREVRTCPWCGREFVPRRNAIWCSRRCRDHGRRHHMSAIAGLIAQTELLDAKLREVT
jgi:hypothetical protein